MMKIKLFIALLVFSITNSFAQKAIQHDATLGFFQLTVDPQFRADLVDLEEAFKNGKDELFFKDPLVSGIIDKTYQKIDLALKERSNYVLLDPEILKNKEGKRLLYTPYGYPSATMKRAATYQTSDYYIKLMVNVYARFGSEEKTNLGIYKNEKKKYRPGVRIQLTLFDKNGKKIEKYVGKAKTKEKIIVETQVLQQWFKIGEEKRFNDSDNQQVLQEVINAAITNLITNMNN